MRISAVIKGIPVTLYERTVSGVDAFGRTTYAERPVVVDNVLVGEPSSEERVSALDLTGRRAAYVLAIPKGDAHNWENCRVDFSASGSELSGSRLKALRPIYHFCGTKKRGWSGLSKPRIKGNYTGIGSLLRAPEIESVTAETASGILSRCGNGYASDTKNGQHRKVISIYTADYASSVDNLENNTLLKALGG